MNILIIGTHFTDHLAGGEGKRSYELSEKMSEDLENDITIITYKFSDKKNNINSRIKSVQINFLFSRYKFPLITVKQFWEILKLIKNAQAIHLMGYWNLIYFFVYPMIKFYNKKYVICPAGSISYQDRSKFLKYLYSFFLGKRILQKAFKCIAIVETEIANFRNYGVKEKNIIVIPNGISIKNTIKKNVELKDYSFTKSGQDFILFVGRLNFIKGPDILLKAFKQISDEFKNLKLVFAGNDQGMLDQLSEFCKVNNINDRVFFLGFQNVEEKSYLYAKAKLVVIPSRSEAMSIVFLEAAAHGTPVLLTNKCGLNFVEKYGIAKLSNPEFKEMSSKISDVLNNKQWQKDSSKKLLNFVKKNYEWSKIIEKYQKVFLDMSNDNLQSNKSIYSFLRQLYYNFKTLSLVKINTNPIGTHAPVLIGLGRLFKVQSVLELGTGLISTPLFLDKKNFNHLTRLVSYENNLGWYQYVKKKNKQQKKWDLKFVKGSISENIIEESVNDYDVVFVDDSNRSIDRRNTIKKALEIKTKFLIIHDFENPYYYFNLFRSRKVKRIKSLVPNTGIIYSQNVEEKDLLHLIKVIEDNSKIIDVNDIKSWREAFLN